VVKLDADQIFLIALLIVLAVVIYLELRFMRSRNKEYIEQMMDKDEAYNAIATTKAIASTLKQKGRDTKEAELTLIQAENSYKRNKFISACDSAKRARELLMNAPSLEIAAPLDKDEVQPASDEDRKTVQEVKKLEPHLMESRFIINSCRDRLKAEEGSGKDLSKADEHLARAEACFEEKKYDEALREGLKARRLLEDAPKPSEPPKNAVLMKVPKPEKRCEKCSATVSSEDVFCRKCGAPIVVKRVCAFCRAELAAEDVFCPKCGRKV